MPPRLMIVLLAANVFAGAGQSRADEPAAAPGDACQIKLAKAEDVAEVQFDQDTLVVTVQSKSGIGSLKATRTGREWPLGFLVRLRLTGLERFRVSAGDITLETAISSTGKHEQRTTQIIDHREVPLAREHRMWIECRMLNAMGEAANQIPLKDGVFELTLPAELLKTNPQTLQLEWIDFYRG